MGRKEIPGFKDSGVGPRESNMNPELIRSLAETTEITLAELTVLLSEHKDFVTTGGDYGQFNRLEVAGLPMNIYLGSASRGKQFEIRLKKLGRFTDLVGADLRVADMSGSLCEGVDFKMAILDGAMMTDAFFYESNFEGASCQRTDFTCSDLRYANFQNADLRNADFENANCEYADFRGAILDDASFKGANLENIKY